MSIHSSRRQFRQSAVRALHRTAFTLIELLVVISIITLLISILLPALRNARVSGQRVQSLTNVRQLTMAMRLYNDDFKGSFPYSILDKPVASGGSSPNLESWAFHLRRRGSISGYISDYRIFWSPARSLAWAENHFKNDHNFSRPGFSPYIRGMMPNENAGYKPMIIDLPRNPPPSRHLMFLEGFDTSFFGSTGNDGKHAFDLQSLPPDVIGFTYNGTVTRSYVDGHAVATNGVDIGWKPGSHARDGEWMRYGTSPVFPNTSLMKEPFYRRTSAGEFNF